jgi:hypothetical protein
MAATPELLSQATPPASPVAPPVSSTPAPAPVNVHVPTFLAPPPVRAPEVDAHVTTVAEPLFTVKVWQLGFAVIVLLAALLYFLGII